MKNFNTAIYARQSAERKDSISIENQIETCKRKLACCENTDDIEGKIHLYLCADRGFSGKNTQRPELKRMMSLVREGRIKRVIVYKLDRISRSMLDFLKIQEEFDKHGVEFISCGEDFDTGTPMGKMMLHILMVFAEMERETIQKRVRDNYYARGEKGFYLGGYPPFGFNKAETLINGKKTYYFTENKAESDTLRYLYEQFAVQHKSASELVRELNDRNIKTRRGGAWNQTAMTRLLSNPAYVKSDITVYAYLKAKGATVNNPVCDFNGKNGCYVYGKAAERSGIKFKSYKSDFVTIAPHYGIIEPSLWLTVQDRLDSNSATRGSGGRTDSKGSLSWIQGLVKCECGYSQYVKHIKNKYSDLRYFYCRGKKQHTCTAETKMLRADTLERKAEAAIIDKLKTLQNFDSARNHQEAAINARKIERDKARVQIDNLVVQIADGGHQNSAAKYITETIQTLDRKIAALDYEIMRIESGENRIDANAVLADWKSYTTAQKKRIAQVFIKEIRGEDVIMCF